MEYFETACEIPESLTVVATAVIKYSNSPQLTKGNIQAFNNLKAHMNYVVSPSYDDFLLKEVSEFAP